MKFSLKPHALRPLRRATYAVMQRFTSIHPGLKSWNVHDDCGYEMSVPSGL
jgi:hypothetical protein